MPFASLELHPTLLHSVSRLGFEKPTPIQSATVPALLKGRDIIACAQTGSGKTAAFLLPIVQHLMGQPRGTTRALILTPTRELAAQIAEHLGDLARGTGIKGATVYGGVAMAPQKEAFVRNVDVIIAAPGRLLDHLQYPYAKLDKITHVVLDEADRMLDMGFLPDVRRILNRVPRDRQTLLFSATMPPPIAALARDILRNPLTVDMGQRSTPATGITHTVFPVRAELKTMLLLEILKRETHDSVLAFTRTKHRANRLAEFLEKHGVACARIHGNRSQGQRTQALSGFKSGEFRVLVATDVAARGIDVEELALVVNFDMPDGADDYIHRVGRTARASAKGHAFTFVTPEDEGELREIEKRIGLKLERRKLDEFDYQHRAPERFEVPIAERLAAMRAQKAKARANGKGGKPQPRGGSHAPARGSAAAAPRRSSGAHAAASPKRTPGTHVGAAPKRPSSAHAGPGPKRTSGAHAAASRTHASGAGSPVASPRHTAEAPSVTPKRPAGGMPDWVVRKKSPGVGAGNRRRRFGASAGSARRSER